MSLREEGAVVDMNSAPSCSGRFREGTRDSPETQREQERGTCFGSSDGPRLKTVCHASRPRCHRGHFRGQRQRGVEEYRAVLQDRPAEHADQRAERPLDVSVRRNHQELDMKARCACLYNHTDRGRTQTGYMLHGKGKSTSRVGRCVAKPFL